MTFSGLQAVLDAHPDLAKYPDRMYLLSQILPDLKGKVVSVGCESYNSFDHMCLDEDVEYVTVDSNPSNSRFGSPGGHVVDDILSYLERLEPYSLDAVVLFGVLGTGPIDEHYNLDERLADLWLLLVKAVRLGGQAVIAPHCSGGPFGCFSRTKNYLKWRFRIRRGLEGSLGFNLVNIKHFRLNPIFVLDRKSCG